KQLASEADRDAPGLPVPQDALTALVGEVWKSVLPPDCAVTSPFFAAGGDSLRAMDLVVRLQAMGIPAAINQIYQHQDFDAFVGCIRLSSADDRPSDVMTSNALPTPRQEEMLGEVYAG